MPAVDIPSIYSSVLWAFFAIGLVFGYVGQRGNFCTMGAVSDVVNMGDWSRARTCAVAIAVATLGFGSLVFTGIVDPNKTLYATSRVLWLSSAVGGLMFGFGMVLASGCGSKTLLRLGSGSLKALVVFVVMGIAAFATLKGITAVLRVATVDAVFVATAAPAANLPASLAAAMGMHVKTLSLLCAAVFAGTLVLWVVSQAEGRSSSVWMTGAFIGACGVAAWYVSAKVGYVAEHPDTLQEAFIGTFSGRAEALNFVAPSANALDWLLFFSDKSKVLTSGVVCVVGVVLGSAAYALTSKSFRWEGFASTDDTAHHLVGAVLMGIGGVVAMGCTVGQGLSGLSTLSYMSFIAVAFIVLGAVWGIKYQTWYLERSI